METIITLAAAGKRTAAGHRATSSARKLAGCPATGKNYVVNDDGFDPGNGIPPAFRITDAGGVFGSILAIAPTVIAIGRSVRFARLVPVVAWTGGIFRTHNLRTIGMDGL